MTLYINQFGEFVDPDPPDKDLRRRDVYSNCVAVDMKSVRKSIKRDERKLRESKDVEMAECRYCHEMFQKRNARQEYCSKLCQSRGYNQARREELAAERAAKPNTKPKGECQNCHETFEMKRRGQKYCCPKCREEYRNWLRRKMRR